MNNELFSGLGKICLASIGLSLVLLQTTDFHWAVDLIPVYAAGVMVVLGLYSSYVFDITRD